LVQKFSRIKVYNAGFPHSFIWKQNLDPQKKKDKRKRLTLIEVNIFRYSFFDHKRNEEILEKLKVDPVDEKLRRYKSNSL